MEFGVHLPHLGNQASGPTLKAFAQKAEALGYHSGWVSDHIAWPQSVASRYPYTENGDFPAPFGMPWLDPLGTLIYAAACTERLMLGTTVLILGYRPPVQTAKLLATLDALSAGRAILGVGVGWMKEEFEALGMPFDHRGARGDEQLEAFEALFTQPLATYHGRFYQFEELGFSPKPVNGRIPIWVGGDTEAAFRRCARFGECFHSAFTPKEKLVAEWARVQELVKEAGRDPGEVSLSVRLYLDPGRVMDPAKSIAGTAAEMEGQVAAWRAIGVSHILIDVTAPGGVQGRMAAMEAFATDVMAKVA